MPPTTNPRPQRPVDAAVAAGGSQRCGATAESIRVYCRVRPLSHKEKATPADAAMAVSFPPAQTADGSEVIVCEQPLQPMAGTGTGASTPSKQQVQHQQHLQQQRDDLRFSFTRVLKPTATQADVYVCAAREIVAGVVRGYNGTVFAYGQTGSGKTHTMFGRSPSARQAKPRPHVDENVVSNRAQSGHVAGTHEEHAGSAMETSRSESGSDNGGSEVQEGGVPSANSTPRASAKIRGTSSSGGDNGAPSPRASGEKGIIPRAVADIFNLIAQADAQFTFEVSLFFIEVYMEQVRDLLAPAAASGHHHAHASPPRLRVREDVDSGSFYVDGCAVHFVGSAAEVLTHVEAGLARRTTHATRMNEFSSRSHCILNLTIKSMHTTTKEVTTGKLFLVDLAGSEKVSKTGSAGVRLEEAKQINRSLTSLGMVIAALSEAASHVPYRNSVLTMLLKDSLGGNARTALVMCCSPSRKNVGETLSTLRFGVRAGNVQNSAVVNKEMSVKALSRLLAEAKREIARLRRELRESGATTATPATTASASAAAAKKDDENATACNVDRPADGEPGGDAEGVLGGACDGTDTLLSVRSEDRPRLSSLAELRLRIRTLEVGVAALEDTLRDTNEAKDALTEEREAQRERIACLEEAAVAAEDRYVDLQRASAADQRELAHVRFIARQRADEIALLISQLESHLKPIRMARALLEEREQHRMALLGPGVSTHRRRTLAVLEDGLIDNGESGATVLRHGGHPRDADVMLFPSRGNGAHRNNSSNSSTAATAAAGEEATGASPQARPPSTLTFTTATVAAVATTADGEGGRGTAGTALLGAGSSFGATSTSPLRFGASVPANGEATPCNPNAAGGGDGDGVNHERSSDFDVTDSTLMNQALLNIAARELVVARASGDRDTTQAALPSTGEAHIGPRLGSHVSSMQCNPSQVDTGANRGWLLSTAAARRVAELEAELDEAESRLAASSRAGSTLKLELQHAEKIMGKRQERIESLNLCLQHAANENRELHRILDTDRAASKKSLKRARDDVAYWQRKYEELSAQLRPPEGLSLGFGLAGAAIVKPLRGGGNAPASGTDEKAKLSDRILGDGTDNYNAGA